MSFAFNGRFKLLHNSFLFYTKPQNSWKHYPRMFLFLYLESRNKNTFINCRAIKALTPPLELKKKLKIKKKISFFAASLKYITGFI